MEVVDCFVAHIWLGSDTLWDELKTLMYVCEQAPSPKTLCKCLVYGVLFMFDYVLQHPLYLWVVCGLIGNWFMIIWDYIVGSFMAIYISLYLPVAWCRLGTRSPASTAMFWSGHVGWGLIWEVVVCDLCESNTVLKSVGSPYYNYYPNYIFIVLRNA